MNTSAIRMPFLKHFLPGFGIFLILLTAAGSGADIIIDNGQSGTSFTGTWSTSAATGFYGTDSLWGRNGATYTWSFDSEPAGLYEVSMWWTEYSSRSDAAPVAINHAMGTENLTVNQQTDGGDWNLLGTGTYYFDTAGSVTLSAPGSYSP